MIRIYQRDMKNILQSGQAGIDVTHYPATIQFLSVLISGYQHHGQA